MTDPISSSIKSYCMIALALGFLAFNLEVFGMRSTLLEGKLDPSQAANSTILHSSHHHHHHGPYTSSYSAWKVCLEETCTSATDNSLRQSPSLLSKVKAIQAMGILAVLSVGAAGVPLVLGALGRETTLLTLVAIACSFCAMAFTVAAASIVTSLAAVTRATTTHNSNVDTDAILPATEVSYGYAYGMLWAAFVLLLFQLPVTARVWFLQRGEVKVEKETEQRKTHIATLMLRTDNVGGWDGGVTSTSHSPHRHQLQDPLMGTKASSSNML